MIASHCREPPKRSSTFAASAAAGVLRVALAVLEELARGAVGDREVDDHEHVGLASAMSRPTMG